MHLIEGVGRHTMGRGQWPATDGGGWDEKRGTTSERAH